MNFDNVSTLGENDTHVVDLSGNGNNGTFNGTVNMSGGKYNGGFEFDGIDDLVLIPENTYPIDSGDVTFILWAKRNAIGSSYTLMGGVSDGLRNMRLMDIGTYRLESNTNGDTLSAILNSNDTNWHQYATVVSGGVGVVYQDAVLLAGSRSFTDNITMAAIGCSDWDDSPSSLFNGTIDEVRIYNRSLSAEEIQILYMSNLRKYDTDKWLFYINQTKNATAGLDNGNYTYQAFAADNSSNWNQTEERTITIGEVQSLFNISFVSPTPDNGTTQSETFVEINVSINESSLDEVVWNWNGTNYTLFNDSLVLMMNFDNVSTLGENDTHVVDLSGNGNNGTFNGTVNMSGGKYNGGFEFDGIDDLVLIPENTYPIDSGDVTFILWAKRNAIGSSYTLMGGVSDGLRNMRLMDIGTYRLESNTNGDTLSAILNSNDTNWHQYATVVSGGVGVVYQDAVLLAGSRSFTDNITMAAIGCSDWDDSPSSLFNGTIDEVRIYNRSLSAEEIQILYMSNLRKYDTDKWLFYINQTKNATAGLDNGNYTYQAFAADNSSNWNQTEERTITIGEVQSLFNISFVSPTPDNGTTQPENYVDINVSINTTLDEFKWNWNGTNFTIMNDNLVLMYNFDNVSALGENDTYVVDLSGQGNNGTGINGAVVNTTDCMYGNCYTFDGVDDFISVGDDGSLDITQNITLSAWVIPREIAGFGQILAKRDGSVCNYAIYRRSGNLEAGFYFYNTDWRTYVTDNEEFSLNTWSHMVAVHSFGDASSTKIYIDGVHVPATWGGGDGGQAAIINDDAITKSAISFV